MNSARNVGRRIGIILLLQLGAGLMVPFILMRPLVTGSPGFLTAAAENASQIRAAVVISFIGAAFTLYLGITALPVFRRYGNATALWFLAACTVSLVLDAVHNSTVMSMLSLSQQYVDGGAANQELYYGLGKVVAAARRSAHVTQLLAIGVWIFVFYSSLLRFGLIPRWLAAVGVLGILSQFTGVTLMMFLGYSSIGQMAMPLLPIQIAVAVWLIVKGFNETPPETKEEPVGERSAEI